MRKRIQLLFLAACLLSVMPVSAEEADRPQIILMACYQQVGWGVYANAVFLDEAGSIWDYENEAGLPKDTYERLELLSTTEEAKCTGQLDERRVEELQSLIAAIQPEEVNRSPGHISDYGLDTYSAIRYDDSKDAEIICLAQWGDWIYENTDVNAHAAYLSLFTEVLGNKLDNDESALQNKITPFERMSLADFCDVEKDFFKGATVTIRKNGTEQVLKKTEAKKKLAWLRNLAITGKRSALTADGDEVTYLLTTPEETTAEFTFSGDLLVQPDGMYTVEELRPKEIKKLENLKKAQDDINKVRKNNRKKRSEE